MYIGKVHHIYTKRREFNISRIYSKTCPTLLKITSYRCRETTELSIFYQRQIPGASVLSMETISSYLEAYTKPHSCVTEKKKNLLVLNLSILYKAKWKWVNFRDICFSWGGDVSGVIIFIPQPPSHRNLQCVLNASFHKFLRQNLIPSILQNRNIIWINSCL